MISIETLADEVKSGLKLSEIAEKHQCSNTTAYREIKKLGLSCLRRKYNLQGRKFGRLSVVEKDNSGKIGSWLCICECGNNVSVKTDHLLQGHTNSCGCYAHDFRWTGHGEISGNYWGQIKRGASKRNFEFSITIEEAWSLFLKQKRKCALSGLPLIFYTNPKDKSQIQTASLDRINSKKGYTLDNIQWIHKVVQRMKWDQDEKEFRKFCKLIVENNNEG